VYSRRVETGFLPYYTIISWDEVRPLTPLLDYQQKQTPNKKFTFSKQKKISSHVTHLLVEVLRMFLAMVFSTHIDYWL
jgi:hypothetical protein